MAIRDSGLLTDVLEEGAGQHRQMKFDVEDDEEHAEKASADAHLQKLSGVGHDGGREQERRGDGDEALAKGHIFEDWPIGKSAQLFEECTTNEEGLVAVDDPAADAAEIIQERNQLESPVVA
jgi:hypothetical protein